MMLTKRRIAAAAAIAFAVGAGITYAAIPDSSGVIHGCVNDGSGLLRVIDTGQSCKPAETGLDWVQSAGYQVFGSNIEITAVAPTPLQQVVSLTLPPGSYAISAEFNFEKPTGDGVLACAVVTGGLYSAPVGGWVAVGTGPGDSRANQFSGTGLDVLPNGGTARLVCRQWNGATGANPVIAQVGLNAVRIGTVNEQ
jgi:hypothetical protein